MQILEILPQRKIISAGFHTHSYAHKRIKSLFNANVVKSTLGGAVAWCATVCKCKFLTVYSERARYIRRLIYTV